MYVHIAWHTQMGRLSSVIVNTITIIYAIHGGICQLLLRMSEYAKAFLVYKEMPPWQFL